MFQGEECTQMWSKDTSANHVSLVWITQVCDGKKTVAKIHCSFTQTADTNYYMRKQTVNY
jgi:hypothetical protein